MLNQNLWVKNGFAVFDYLNSVQDTIAESKKEREQHDRLLTISTPHERLLILTISLLFFTLGIWFFTGDVKKYISADALLVEVEAPLDTNNQLVEVVVWLSTDDAPRIKIGTLTKLDFNTASGDVFSINGEIVLLANSTNPQQEQMSLITELAGGSLYQARISLAEKIDITSKLNKECEVEFHIGQVTPFQFFLMS